MPARKAGDIGAEAYYRRVYDLSNDYAETVWTLLAFSAFVCHDGRGRRAGSGFGFGRRMRTSCDNPVAAEADVTPDCVAQMGPEYGIAAEVKKQISNEPEQWEPHLRQLRKYDDTLTGWWTDTETIAVSDAVLLIHRSRTRRFVQYLERRRAEDPACVGPNTAVVEFTRSDEGRSYVAFRTEWGRVRNPELAERLNLDVSVPMDRVARSFPSAKFYDAEPPVEHLMAMIWTDLASRIDFGTPGDQDVAVVVSDLTAEMQRAYGSQALPHDQRSPEFPRISWVRRAMDQFVAINLATTSGDGERYTVRYRFFSGDKMDLLQRLCTMVAAREAKRPPPGQLPLGL